MTTQRDPQPDSTPSARLFEPTATLEMLVARAQLLSELRRFFHESGYWEVETPLLSHDVVVDAWLEPYVASQQRSADRSKSRVMPGDEELFLQTSPEFGMKRLLASGAEAIYQITRAFRAGECGQHHNPEFTIVEWYRVGDTYHDQMSFVEQMVRHIFTNSPQSACDAHPDTTGRYERLSYDAAFERHAGTRVLKLATEQLVELAAQRGIAAPTSLKRADRDGWLNLLLADLVESHLGTEVPTFLYDYPASQAALACIRDGDPPVAERFELYIAGIEICNGYQELTDPAELRTRSLRQSELRSQEGLRELPIENRLLSAMEAGLPACSGVALGFDRLAMLALGARSIAEVISFPFDRA